jgi:DNA-binding IclR family transcriptional regulator
MSTPVFDHQGELCAAITVLDATSRLRPDPDGSTAIALKEAADNIGRRLGAKLQKA